MWFENFILKKKIEKSFVVPDPLKLFFTLPIYKSTLRVSKHFIELIEKTEILTAINLVDSIDFVAISKIDQEFNRFIRSRRWIARSDKNISADCKGLKI